MKKRFGAIFVSSLLFLAIPACIFSQNLDDFKEAKGNLGVKSIPFSSLRGEAGSIQDDINSCRVTCQSFENWKTYDRNKSKDYTAIRMEKEDIKKKQDYIASLKEKNVNASEFEKELEANFKTLQGYNEDIAAINYQINKAIDAWDMMYRLRGKLKVKFNDVLIKLSEAKSSPNQFLGNNPTEEDRSRLLEYINSIEENIKSEESGHATAEKEANDAKENMQRVLARSSE